MMPQEKRLVTVGPAERFRIGEFQIVTVDDREVGVIRLPDGSFRAVLNACPHRGAPVCGGLVGGTWPPCDRTRLEFSLDQRVLVCPWHGWQFDLRTGVELFRSRPARLRLFETSVDNGVVSVVV
jgi:nitrite reductase/ring-hydroxylating ferredoxin subunit